MNGLNVSEQKMIFIMAEKYLLSFEGIDHDILNNHLDEWKDSAPESMEDLFFGMLDSIKNRQGMPNFIGEIEELRSVLHDFDVNTIIEEYADDWELLFRRVQNQCHPPGRMEIQKPKNSWVQFCKSILSGAKFLSQFSNVTEFNTFVERFYLNEYTRVALPLLLQKEIFGLGFALACDFLKENGYPEYCKPDVHIKSIFTGLGISKSDSDYEVFKDIIRFSKAINELPYKVDKMFWLVGSGKFYLDNIQKPTSRDAFIRSVKKELQLNSSYS
ncbi:MAG: hypothetical protein WC325_05340 [Candidatus Bathyarchaeia archaeon]